MNIVHLHTHSDYSLLDGLVKINALVAKAAHLRMSALALTDHGVMYGAIKFYKACKEAGINPIIGCEIYIAPRKRTDKDGKTDTKPYHLTLLVKNIEGYKNLLRIVSEGHLTGFYYKPRVDKEFLSKYSKGLICLSGCPAGEIPRAVQSGNLEKAKKVAQKYIDIFGKENFFFEIQPHKMEITKKTNEGIITLAKDLDMPLVATNDIHYLNKEDTEAHEVLLAVNTGKDLENEERLSLQEASLYMMTAEEMLKALPDHPEAIENTEKLAKMVNLEMEFGQSILPEFPLPKGKTNIEYLTEKAIAGFIKRFSKKPDLKSKEDPQKDPSARLIYELDIIEKTGFASYFLIVSDFVNWAKEQKIEVGPGRGSAAGSIVSYCLNITDLDPLKYELLFERFLNPERIAMPDIDLDFADTRRNEVIEYIKNKYGEDHVAQIITFGIMKSRLAVRDVARSMGFAYEVGDKIAKLIPMGLTLEEAFKSSVEIRDLYEDDPAVKKVIDMSYKLEGVARHASTHAAGVVISKNPLVEYLPLQRSTSGVEGVTTQYDMVDVENIGLLKIDILGLANLTIIQNALRIIRKTENKRIDIRDIDLEDKETFKLLSNGETIGVFQLESEGMRHYIKELKPNRMEDIMAMVSLYRPGPMELIPDYIEARHGRKAISYLHPKLEPILSDTYGIAVYQEQILQIARDIAGFTYGEADVLRKAIGKKIRSLLLQQRRKFIDGATLRGIDKVTAGKLFDFAEPFARYGFNRAHAASYALIAYRTAFLKAHYPHAFMAALLTSEHKDLDKVAFAINECERMGISVLPPDINESFVEFGVVETDNEKTNKKEKVIRFGLGAIKNVGEKAADLITKDRKKNGKFKSFEEFLLRLGGTVINKKIIESLAKSGALNGMVSRSEVIAGIEEVVKFAQNAAKAKNSSQADLFGSQVKVEIGKLKLPKVAQATKKQKLSWEKEFLGLYLSDHPLKDYSGKINKLGIDFIGNIGNDSIDGYVRIAGIVTGFRKITTKSNQPMAFVQFEDLTGALELVIFPSVLEKNSSIWEKPVPIVVDGKVSTKDGAIKILVSNVYDINDEIPIRERKSKKIATKYKKSSAKNYRILLPKGVSKNLLQKLKILLKKYPGNTPVELLIPLNGDVHTVDTKIDVAKSEKLENEINELLIHKN